jgi:hypothetical protein
VLLSHFLCAVVITADDTISFKSLDSQRQLKFLRCDGFVILQELLKSVHKRRVYMQTGGLRKLGRQRAGWEGEGRKNVRMLRIRKWGVGSSQESRRFGGGGDTERRKDCL